MHSYFLLSGVYAVVIPLLKNVTNRLLGYVQRMLNQIALSSKKTQR
jgi:hypothetical protein